MLLPSSSISKAHLLSENMVDRGEEKISAEATVIAFLVMSVTPWAVAFANEISSESGLPIAIYSVSAYPTATFPLAPKPQKSNIQASSVPSSAPSETSSDLAFTATSSSQVDPSTPSMQTTVGTLTCPSTQVGTRMFQSMLSTACLMRKSKSSHPVCLLTLKSVLIRARFSPSSSS